MEPVDFYCERVAAGFGGEPLNAASALAFLAVGLWRWRAEPGEADRLVAVALMVLGVAACVHHLFALRLTLLADIWANIVYLSVFGALLLRRLGGMGPVAVWITLPVVFLLSEGLGLPAVRAVLGRGADMFVLLACLLALLALWQRGMPATARGLGLGALILVLGLPLRFWDHALCAAVPVGTHWLWHMVNAASIAVVLDALGRHRRVA